MNICYEIINFTSRMQPSPTKSKLTTYMDDKVLLWFSPTYNRIQINVARTYRWVVRRQKKCVLTFFEKMLPWLVFFQSKFSSLQNV